MHFTPDEVRTLVEQVREPCVSIFMPTHRSGRDIQQDRIRFKNLAREGSERLVAMGMRGADAAALLNQTEAPTSQPIWDHPKDGLAAFVSPGFVRSYRVDVTLPEQVVAGRRAYLVPLLPLLGQRDAFHILCLSQGGARLLRAVDEQIREVPLPQDTPHSLPEALGTDSPQKTLNFHTGTPQSSAAGERRGAIFFGGGGSGPGDEINKQEAAKFCRRLDDGLHKLLATSHEPVVVAAVAHLIPIYRSVSRLPTLMEKGIEGNPEAFSDAQLRDMAKAIVQPQLRAAEDKAATRLADSIGNGKASADPKTILPALLDGRVDTLFVASGATLHGRFDEASRKLVLGDGNGSEDLIDRAAHECIRHRGALYTRAPSAMPMPGALAALFRY